MTRSFDSITFDSRKELTSIINAINDLENSKNEEINEFLNLLKQMEFEW